MSQLWRHQAILIAVALFVFFTNLGGAHLFDDDEPRNAACAVEMMERGNLVVPMFNGELREHKPVLLYWFMASAYSVLGVSEFSARLWSALFAVGTVLCTYHVGRLLLDRQIALWAGLMMSSCPMFTAVGRAATPESMLVFFTTLALLLYVVFVLREKRGFLPEMWPEAVDRTDGGLRFLPRSRFAWIVLYFIFGVAVLAKGPVGVVIPAATIGLFVILIQYFDRLRNTTTAENEPKTIFGRVTWLVGNIRVSDFTRALWAMHPVTGLCVGLAVALPWYIAVGYMTGGDWIMGFLVEHNLGRFMQPMENHRGNSLYYVVAILAGAFPWSVILPLAMFSAARRLQTGTPQQATYLFIMTWAVFQVAFYSLASTKLPHYILSAYPALALLTSAFLVNWVRGEVPVYRAWMRVGFGSMIATGVVMTAGLATAAYIFLPGAEWLGVAGLVPVLGGVAACVWHEQGRRERAALALATTAVAMSAVVFHFGAEVVNGYQNSAAIAAAAGKTDGEPVDIAAYRYFRPTMTFYAGQPVPMLHFGQDVAKFWSEAPAGCVVLRSDHLPDFEQQVGPDFETVFRQRRFLGHDEILVVRQKTQLATTDQATTTKTR
jgi:4-amino-4-deoxy-L-arabinose transferase-like glycosyltransferase